MTKKKSSRKVVKMLVTVSGPDFLTAGQIRREVRSFIQYGVGYLSHGPNYEEIKISLKRLGPVKS